MLDYMCERLRIELKDVIIIYIDIYVIKYSFIVNFKVYGKVELFIFFYY